MKTILYVAVLLLPVAARAQEQKLPSQPLQEFAAQPVLAPATLHSALAPAAAVPAVDRTKEDRIRDLLEQTGYVAQAEQFIYEFLVQARIDYPEVPDAYWERLQEKLDAESFVELLIPIYDRHLTTEDVEGLIAYYRSPLGQKMLAKQDIITEEAYAAGAQWGTMLADEVMDSIVKAEMSR